VFVAGLVAATVPMAVQAAPKDGKGGQAADDAPTVPTLVPMMDSFKWGASPQDVINQHNNVGGILDKDYDPLLLKVQPGVQQKALEADRDNRKLAFQKTFLEFKDTPTGLDATALKTEYSYRNKEAVLWIERAGKKFYFFFIGGRLWKLYEEIPFDETGPLGKTYQEAITKLQTALGVQGRVRATDPSKGITTTTVDWQDATTHLRALDRGRIVAVVLEERNTLNNLVSLRANKVEDPLALDPSIAAITRGGISDPNQKGGGAPAGSASGKPGKGGGTKGQK
jgi:hypothetical protein